MKLTDSDHLKFCMDWLLKAQSVTSDGGVSSIYEADKKLWRKSYPETTGYIIPTFLAYYDFTKEVNFKEAATRMGDWEIEIQSDSGGTGEYLGFYSSKTFKPRNFNTGQVILGYLALYKLTKEQKYLTAAEKSAEYIMRSIDNEGTWSFSTFNTPKSYNIRVAWSLLELFEVTKNESHKIAGERITQWTLRQSNNNGWFTKNSFSGLDKGIREDGFTHLIGYTLVGLIEIYRLKNSN